MKQLLSLIGLLLCFVSIGYGQFVLQNSNAKQSGMGNTKVLTDDAFASLYNPAAFSSQQKLAVGLSYTPSQMVSGLKDIQVGTQFSFKNNTVGIGIISNGSALLREQLIGLNYAKNFVNWNLGARLNLLSIYQSDQAYGNSCKITASIGASVKVKSNLRLGAYINHLNPTSFDKAKQEKVATTFITGFQYLVSKQVTTTLEAEKNLVAPINIKAGLAYNFQKQFFIRAGFQTSPVRPTIGFGCLYQNWQLDYGFQNQNTIGAIHSIGLSFHFLKNN